MQAERPPSYLIWLAVVASALQSMLVHNQFEVIPEYAGCTSPTPVKTIECLEVLEQPACPHWAPPSSVSFLAKGQLRSVVIKVRANAFLYHMVRLLVGWLVEVGSGQQEAARTPEVLQQKAIQALKCGAAPPCGLYLAEVHYNPESFTKPSPLRFADEVDAEDSGGE